MSRDVRIYQLPDEIRPGELRGSIAVIIDVLRASTTIVHALAAGARCVIPFGDVDVARKFAAELPRGTVVLGGERGGVLIDGFDLGNSPESYTQEVVGGRIVAFTTTNGTRALLRSGEADRIVIGSFVNLAAVVDVLTRETRPVRIVCAGTDGRVTSEDVLCAGSIAAEFRNRVGEIVAPDASTAEAMGMADLQGRTPQEVLQSLRASHGGKNLIELGYDADIVRSARRDLFPIVPEFGHETGRIVA
ncbi:MAG: 2-phosphosulfolactate phosphatase [Planctomycetaceae bacterium]